LQWFDHSGDAGGWAGFVCTDNKAMPTAGAFQKIDAPIT